jgi:hypothetical protein
MAFIRTHSVTALLLSFCASFVPFCGQSFAALDPEADKPYQLDVVLHFAEHRVFTPVFKDQVERELRDSLRAALGDLAKVEVVRPEPGKHPRLKEVLDKGLQTALDGWKDVSPVKTHFVLIDYDNGQYQVRARQYDGLTAQASPVARRDRTPDRQFVARTAALLVDRDFGPVGTVIPKSADKVHVTLKGGKLGVPLKRWVHKGDVFVLVRISQAGGALHAQPVPWALLRVEDEPGDDGCDAQLFHRHPDPLADRAGTLGFRCLKIATVQAPLRLRLVKARARSVTPEPNVQLHVRQTSFSDEVNKLQGVTDADGYFDTVREEQRPVRFDRVAFVSVLTDNVVRARIPVALVEDRVVVCPVTISHDAVTSLHLERDFWVQRLHDSQLLLTTLFRELQVMVGKSEQRATALEKAQARLAALDDDLDRFTKEQGRLEARAAEARKAAPGTRLDLAEGLQKLRDLKEGRNDLQRFAAGLEKILKEENDPVRKQLRALVEEAHLRERAFEFDEAIQRYQKALDGGLNDPALRDHLDKLKKDWQLAGDEHQKAREFIYQVWPGLDLDGLRARLPEARKAFQTCQAAGDALTPRKLLVATNAHVRKLKEQHDALQPDVIEDHKKKAEALLEVTEGINKLREEVTSYIDRSAGGK